MGVDHFVVSSDGASIFLEQNGSGSPLVLVHGTSSDRWSFRFVEPLLAERFTLYAVDRRGRGQSGDSKDGYRIEQEFADIAAVVDSLAQPADVLGHSYGATVSLGAALLARNLRRLILYEPAPGISSVVPEFLARLDALLAEGKRDELLSTVMVEFAGSGPAELEQFRASPVWAPRVAAAHTIAREIRAEENYKPDPDAFATLSIPVMLLLGSESPGWQGRAPMWSTRCSEIVALEFPRFRGHLIFGDDVLRKESTWPGRMRHTRRSSGRELSNLSAPRTSPLERSQMSSASRTRRFATGWPKQRSMRESVTGSRPRNATSCASFAATTSVCGWSVTF